MLPDYVVSDFLCRLRGQNVARFWLMSDVVFVSFLGFLWRFYVVFEILKFYYKNQESVDILHKYPLKILPAAGSLS